MFRKIKKWWKREVSHEYTNPLTKDHTALIKYIEDMGWDEVSLFFFVKDCRQILAFSAV